MKDSIAYFGLKQLFFGRRNKTAQKEMRDDAGGVLYSVARPDEV